MNGCDCVNTLTYPAFISMLNILAGLFLFFYKLAVFLFPNSATGKPILVFHLLGGACLFIDFRLLGTL